MKHLLHILLLLCSLNCTAQNETKEDFVNAIYKTIIRPGKNSYYLSDSTVSFYHFYSDSDNKQLENEFSQYVPPAAHDLIERIGRQTGREHWDFSKLKNAIYFTKDSVILLPPSVAYVDKDTARGAADIKKAQRFSREYRSVYGFSVPVFDSAHRFAAITTSYSCGMLCGYGSIYLYKKQRGRWKLIQVIHTWIS